MLAPWYILAITSLAYFEVLKNCDPKTIWTLLTYLLTYCSFMMTCLHTYIHGQIRCYLLFSIIMVQQVDINLLTCYLKLN